jgi:hypothetical protein
MKKVTNWVLKAVFRQAEAKASPVKGTCVAGCGGDRVWRAAGYTPPGYKPPCC